MAFQALKEAYKKMKSDFLYGQIMIGQRGVTLKNGRFRLDVRRE